MFSPEPMMRLEVIALERDRRRLLADLGARGVVELIETKTPGPPEPRVPRDVGKAIEQCNDMLARVATARQALDIPSATAAVKPEYGSLTQCEHRLREIEERLGKILKERQALHDKLHELTSSYDQLSGFCGAGLPLGQLSQSQFLHFAIGTLPENAFPEWLQHPGNKTAVLSLGARGDRRCVAIITNPQLQGELEQNLQNSSFRSEKLPEFGDSTVDELAAKNRDEQTMALHALEQSTEALKSLAADVSAPLAQIGESVKRERQFLLAEQQLSFTDATILLTGWIPERAAPNVGQALHTVTNGCCAIRLTSSRDWPEEDIPVLLTSSRLLRPFQRLVSVYGLPRYHEIEPTLFVAVSYFLMFGMMFGDAGQGLVLAIVGGIALLKGRKDSTRDLGVLLMTAGISSMIFGAIYGSYFGIPSLKRYALWHDPLEGTPTRLMFLAVGFGVAMISLGLILNTANRLRHRDWANGFLGEFGVAGGLFYWGMLMAIARFLTGRSHGLSAAVIVTAVALPVAAWIIRKILEYRKTLSRELKTKPEGLLLILCDALVGSFEAVLIYFANTVSFVRLAAYAMSHAALLIATFAVAAETSRYANAGPVLGILTIIIGNIISIVLEGIVAAVQGLRLEFYEFFGKFFSGSGRAFKPFQLTPETD